MDPYTPRLDQDRIARAQAVPVEQRRLRNYTARKEAAKRDAVNWAVQVEHSDHDSLKQGVTARSTSHVILSREQFPDPLEAEEVAYLWGQSRGTYPTAVRHQ